MLNVKVTFSNVVATSPHLSFSTVLQRCRNINHDVVATLSQRRCAGWAVISLLLRYAMTNSFMQLTSFFGKTSCDVYMENKEKYLLSLFAMKPSKKKLSIILSNLVISDGTSALFTCF